MINLCLLKELRHKKEVKVKPTQATEPTRPKKVASKSVHPGLGSQAFVKAEKEDDPIFEPNQLQKLTAMMNAKPSPTTLDNKIPYDYDALRNFTTDDKVQVLAAIDLLALHTVSTVRSRWSKLRPALIKAIAHCSYLIDDFTPNYKYPTLDAYSSTVESNQKLGRFTNAEELLNQFIDGGPFPSFLSFFRPHLSAVHSFDFSELDLPTYLNTAASRFYCLPSKIRIIFDLLKDSGTALHAKSHSLVFLDTPGYSSSAPEQPILKPSYYLPN
jgi:hypothetical protein